MNALTERLRRQIALTGPLTVASYMATALGHPRHGYYTCRDPFGMDGDFVTAPEISQMFGELIGLWAVAGWAAMGSPARFVLVEIGPGRGTLMADALRAMATQPACPQAAEPHLVETSPTLRAIQARTLGDAVRGWHDVIAEVPDGPTIVIANELFDALPIHQFVRGEAGWRERLIDRDPFSDGLRFVLAAAPTPTAALLPAEVAVAPGQVAEVSPASIALSDAIGRRIAADGGVALIIDYGREQGLIGDTLQAVRAHGTHDVLADPGEVDLSARVDFGRLARVAREAGARPFGPLTQGAFLGALGIDARAATLKRNATPEQRAEIDAAHERLVSPAAMGALFKVLALTHPDLPAPAGFETEPCSMPAS